MTANLSIPTCYLSLFKVKQKLLNLKKISFLYQRTCPELIFYENLTKTLSKPYHRQHSCIFIRTLSISRYQKAIK